MKAFKYILLIFLASFSVLHAQDKPVYWLHGFQFSPIPASDQFPGRWDLYSSKFAGERQLRSFHPNYARTAAEVEGGMENAANALATQIPDNSSSILIAHSMGGLVARDFDRRNLKTIGGIVTIGTAHNGAKIAANLQNGRILTAAEDGFKILAAAPLATFIDIITDPFGVVRSGVNTGNFIADELWFKILSDRILNLLPPTNSHTLQDMIPNSTFLRGLNAANTHAPMINVILRESNYEVFRMAAAAKDKPEERALHSYTDNKVNSWRTKAESWYKVGKDYYNVLKYVLPFNYSYYSKKEDLYRKGESYLDHGMEIAYNHLNGGIEVVTKSFYREVWRCNYRSLDPYQSSRSQYMSIQPLPVPEDCKSADSPSQCLSCRWVLETFTSSTVGKFDHDGLVTVAAQTPSITTKAFYETYNVNHMEVGNHTEMTITLNSIFERNPGPFYRKKR